MGQTISFTIEEVNEILKYLGNIPAVHSYDLITFIKSKAQEQIAASATVETPAVETPPAV